MRAQRPTVVLLGAVDTLRGLGPAVRAAGLGFRRVEAIRPLPTLPRRVSGPPPWGNRVDTLVVTSRHAVGPILLSWARNRNGGRAPEVWAAGPGTAARLRRLGVRGVHRGSGLGAEGIVRRLGSRHRTIVHVRSDVAGDRTARALRANGHRVTEVVAYRVLTVPEAVRARATWVLRASVLVLSSPTAVDSLRRALGPPVLRALGSRVPVAVLGARTASAAAEAGFRRVGVAPSLTPQRFARFLVRLASDARG